VRAASAMGQLRTVTRTIALAESGRRSAGDVLTRVNQHQLAPDEGEVFTVIYAIIDPGAGLLSWSSAGHPPPLFRTAAGEVEYLDEGDAVIGMEDAPYQTLNRRIAPGDTLILYTDGLIERRGESLDAGMERLARAASAGPADPRALCEHILEALVPERQLHDDITAVVARVTPG
jgi:sigma-B regulation protein RsbU (phosphoserine phosphatase)